MEIQFEWPGRTKYSSKADCIYSDTNWHQYHQYHQKFCVEAKCFYKKCISKEYLWTFFNGKHTCDQCRGHRLKKSNLTNMVIMSLTCFRKNTLLCYHSTGIVFILARDFTSVEEKTRCPHSAESTIVCVWCVFSLLRKNVLFSKLEVKDTVICRQEMHSKQRLIQWRNCSK